MNEMVATFGVGMAMLLGVILGIMYFFLPFIIVCGGVFAIVLFVLNRHSSMAFIMGLVGSFFYYCTLYFSIATLEHKRHTSLYGLEFSVFYNHIAISITLILYALISIKFLVNKHYKINFLNYIINFGYGFQLGYAVLVLIPFKLFALLIAKLGIINQALDFFTFINDLETYRDIVPDLTTPSLSIASYTTYVCFMSLNLIPAFFYLKEFSNEYDNHKKTP